MGKKKSGKKVATPAGDDFDDLLSEFSTAPPAPVLATKDTPPVNDNEEDATKEKAADAAAEYLAQMGLNESTSGAAAEESKKKKKKKGKKKPAQEEDTTKKAKAPSAAAKLVLERQAALKLEEDRLEQLRLEQEAVEKAEEARFQEEERKKAEIALKKKEAKKAKVERLKKEGKYMTKAEKQKAQKAKLALEAMQQAGLVVEAKTGTSSDSKKKKKVVYSTKKSKKEAQVSKKEIPAEVPAKVVVEVEEEEEEEEEEKPKPAAAPAPLLDSWDDDDDWETGDVALALDQLDEQSSSSGPNHADDEEEDLLVVEQRKEQERLRLQGLKIKEREEARANGNNSDDSDDDSSDDSGDDSDSDDDDSDSDNDSRNDSEDDRDVAPKKTNLNSRGKSSGNSSKKHQKSKAQIELDQRKREAAERRRVREAHARAQVSTDHLRSAICCIMGHVDTGKTKLLDNIRRTNVQEGEAGGITQQIGATFFPVDSIAQKVSKIVARPENQDFVFKLPGLLIIDTPGHESFSNLRSRGSSLCDIAILVVDIMHGLEPQTLESLRLLRSKKAPFVVALNKIDRCYGWKTCPDMPIQDALELQDEHVRREFEDRTTKIKVEFAEQGLNAELFWKNDDVGRTVSLIPSSAISGEGVADILWLLTKLTQGRLALSLAFVDILQCTVLEVKVMEGLGTTIDTILVNGHLKEGETIVVCTLEGPVVTTIRSLLTPHPMKEIRVKGEFIHHAEIQAAMGVKVCAPGLEKAVAGTQIYVVGPDDDLDDLKELVMVDLKTIMSSINQTKRGVVVQASTLGALEALLEFLSKQCQPPIPVSGVNIGPVHKRDVVRASVQLEHQPEFATILAFDVKVHHDASELAKESGVRIFTAEIIYHLFDQFTAYMDTIKAARREKYADVAVFPVICRIIPTCIFNKRDPIILGVDIEEGILKVGTPFYIPSLKLAVGKVTSIERDHKEVQTARKGASVAIRIENEHNAIYGRHFDHQQKLYSHLSRESIDALKDNFKDDLTKEDWLCVIKLKKMFDII